MQAGTRFGPWEVLGELGRGGFGVVLRARRADGLEAALKVLTEPLDAESRLRFERELRILGGLSHPSLVRVLDHGLTGQGLAWLALELLPGGTLADRVARQGPLDPAATIALGRALASALGALHAAGVVHRDVKPENVLFDAGGAPRLVDLGLGRGFLPGASRLTATGALLGTPATMAPEQVRGETVGPPADVWSLGATLYLALTGQAPFGAPSALAAMARVLEAEPAPPSALRAGVPQDLEALLLRCLEKDPARRPADGTALDRELARLAWPGPPRPARSRRASTALAAGLLAIGLVVLAALSRRPGTVSATAQPHPAVASTALTAPPRAPSAAEELERYRQHVAALDLPAALAASERALLLEPDLAAAHLARADALLILSRSEEALASYDRALALGAGAGAYLGHSQARVDLGDLPGAMADLDLAVRLAPQDPRVLFNRGLLHTRTREYQAALADAEQGLALAPEDPSLLGLRADALAALGRREEALAAYRQVARVGPLGEDHEHNLGRVLQELGRSEEASAHLSRAIELTGGRRASPYLLRAEARLTLGDDTGALQDLDHAVLAEPRLAEAWLRRGAFRREQGHLPQALADLDQALACAGPPFLQARALGERALVRELQGDPAGALEDCQEGLTRAPRDPDLSAIQERVLRRRGLDQAIARDPGDAEAFVARGRSWLAMGQRGAAPAALADFQQALLLHPDHATALVGRGTVRAILRDWAGAVGDLERGLALEPGATWAAAARPVRARARRKLSPPR